ncbi:MAG: SHOCT domain-containing protein [Cytophagaceae bacterium]|nr:SHOCT domain-containing protein [Cytophagaceae bacterium]
MSTPTTDLKKWDFGFLLPTILIDAQKVTWKVAGSTGTLPTAAVTGFQYDTGLLTAKLIILSSGSEKKELAIHKKPESKQIIDEMNTYLLEMKKAAQPAPHQVFAPVSTADELIKLKGLLDVGVLTPEEFAEQKAKLIGSKPTPPPAVPPNNPLPQQHGAPPPPPRPEKRNATVPSPPDTKSLKIIGTVLAVFCVLGLIVFTIESLKPEPKNETTGIGSDTAAFIPPPPQMEIVNISTSDIGNYVNQNVLMTGKDYSRESVSHMADEEVGRRCRSKPCNVINIWKDRLAYALEGEYQSMKGTASEAQLGRFKKKHWVFICENYLGTYYATVGEFQYYPYVDSEYRKYGGKMTK